MAKGSRVDAFISALATLKLGSRLAIAWAEICWAKTWTKVHSYQYLNLR